MSRQQLATYCLTASALVIAGLICLRAWSFVDTSARAEMAVHKDVLTMISTKFRGDSEILYVLDSHSERLLAYMYNPARRSIDMLPGGSMELTREFARYVGGGAAAPAQNPGFRNHPR